MKHFSAFPPWNILLYHSITANIRYYHFTTLNEMAPHSSTPAWKIPWTEEPGRLQSMGSLRVGHDWATSFPLFTFLRWRRKWQLTPVFLPGESQSWTRMKRLSSSSSSSRYGMEPENLPNKFHMVAQGLLPKSLVLCALMLNKNTETEFWRKEKE